MFYNNRISQNCRGDFSLPILQSRLGTPHLSPQFTRKQDSRLKLRLQTLCPFSLASPPPYRVCMLDPDLETSPGALTVPSGFHSTLRNLSEVNGL